MAEFNPGGAASLDEAVKLRYEANLDTNAYSDAEKTKLSGIAAGATANDSDANLKDRANHTGAQAIATVTGLQTTLDGKAPVSHGHAIGDVTSLQSTLDGKAPVGHSHAIGDVTGLQSTLDGKAPVSHGHAIGDVTSLQTTLDGKAPVGHSHAIGDVTSLQTTLDGKAALAVAQSFTAAQGTAVVALTDGASIATDASLSNQFKVTLGGNRAMAAPTNMVEGRVYEWEIKQDATGSRTLSWNAIFKFPGGTAPTLQTTAGASDVITARFNGTNLHCIHSGGWSA